MPIVPSRSSATVVDTLADASVSFAPLDRPIDREQPGNAAELTAADPAAGRRPDSRTRRRRPRLVVEGVRPTATGSTRAATGGHLGAMPEYPVQVSKVQPPPLRDETLARDRLLEWLSVKIHRRAVLLIAEAGYGKTTLLADFTRRTRVRLLWFRLDRGDRDWVGFLAHLVAAVRVHVPEFGASTSALLRETATTAPPLNTVLDTFLRELGGLPNDASALVFDDFHLVDDSPDVRHILRELLGRGPERMSFVFASRREPPIRLARLRALGEVAELGTNDLRFDATETERLFRETYDMRLEPSVLAELSRRTEGWAASLQLVRSALHERNPTQVRAFISSLSGAEGHLYEYLAEEVVGDLSAELQQFLMRTSLLDTVDLALGPVAAEVSPDDARRLIDEGERNGLFGRHGPSTGHQARAHPLVRDFLQARLVRAIGADGVRAIHLRIARAAEALNWRISARHHLLAGDATAAERVLADSIETILASGAYAAAHELAASLPSGELPGIPGLVLRSRLAQQRAAVDEGLRLARDARAQDPDSPVALLNLVAALTLAGNVEEALAVSRLLGDTGDDSLGDIGLAYQQTIETSMTGSLYVAAETLERLSTSLRDRGDNHYLGVALLNLAMVRSAMGDPDDSLAAADEAIHHLSATSAGVELTSARLARATALAYLGRMEDSRAEIAETVSSSVPGIGLEISIEIGAIEAFLGEPERAWPFIEAVADKISPSTDLGEQAALVRALLFLRAGDLGRAKANVQQLRHGTAQSVMAFEARRMLLESLVLALENDSHATEVARSAVQIATSQGAFLWAWYGTTMLGLIDGDHDPSAAVIARGGDHPVVLSMLAELVLLRISDLSSDAVETVHREALRRPARWRDGVRRLLSEGPARDRLRAADLLTLIGEIEDVVRLRDAGRSGRDRSMARMSGDLARRLAPRVLVEDLGRVRIVVGERVIDGAGIRRKVLALLCLLLSKPKLVSTREEVVDSLWPDLDPSAALNSLNQTVYFLRRVFEPMYRDETSPGYVGQDGETIWLDSELITSTSRQCLELIRSMPDDPPPEGSVSLATLYAGRFALDFAYEDWSAGFRDTLHATYLRVVERAIQMDLKSGNSGRGTFLAERAAEVDPEAEEIQAALVRLYRVSGAHAAAAEQYEHYAATMRDLGVDPVAFADL
jgi:LuxR family maltose regulon positive regulatory protein